MRALGGIRLHHVDPGIADAAVDADVAKALEAVLVPAFELDAGTFDPKRLRTHESVRGRVIGVVLLDGAITVDATVGDRTATRLVGAPQMLFLDGPSRGSLDVVWTFQVPHSARVAVLDDRMLTVVRRWPALLSHLLARAAEQAHDAFLQQAISQLPRVEQRILAFFWALADHSGRVHPDGVRVRLAVTQHDLGQMIGARRPTVSLGLQALAAASLLTHDGGDWLLSTASLDLLAPNRPAAPLRAVDRPAPGGTCAHCSARR